MTGVKTDMLFNQCFRGLQSKHYERTHSNEYHTKVVLNRIKDHALRNVDEKHLKNIIYIQSEWCV